MFEDLKSGRVVRRAEISGQDPSDFYQRILEGISMASEEREQVRLVMIDWFITRQDSRRFLIVIQEF